MLHRTLRVPTGPSPPMHRLRLLIEDPTLAAAGLSDEWRGQMEVSICSGPSSDREGCPLVLEGQCPLGSVDVVVCALDGPWARSVHMAWLDASVRVVDARGYLEECAAERFRHHIGAALSAIISPVTLPSDEES